MDEYAVKLTPRALRDLDEIYAYIADTLLERGTAEALAERLEKGILSLESDKRVKKKTPETVRFRAFPMAQWEGFEQAPRNFCNLLPVKECYIVWNLE